MADEGNPDNGSSEGQQQGQQQVSSPNWRDRLPDDLKSEKSLESIKDVNSLAKGYVEAQRFIGGSFRVPKDDNPEEWAKIYTKLGKPESPDKYEVTFHDDLPEVFKWDDTTQKSFLEMSHKSGLAPKQVQAMLDWNKSNANRVAQTINELGQETAEALKQEWGKAYDRNIAVSNRAAQELGGQEVLDLLGKTGLGNHPAIVRMFAKAGKHLIEDKFISHDFVGIPTKEAAMSKARELQGQPGYFDENHPDHNRLVDEVSKLYEVAYNSIG